MTPRANSNLYADEGPLAEADMSGNITTTYGWSPNGIWGTAPQWKEDVTMGSTGTNPATLTYHYFHNDPLGSSQRLTNDQGVLTWSARMEAFGKTNSIDSIITNLVNGQSQTALMPTTTVNNLRFTGQIEDGERGTFYNYFRDYQASTGRYLQSDPIGLMGGVNTYAYVGNNPLKYFDPKGQDRWGDDPTLRWKPANPGRTNSNICDGLGNGNFIDGDKPGFSSDLSWRDAEHYLFAYNEVMRTKSVMLPSIFYSSAGYSPTKMLLEAVGGKPVDMSPGSFVEAKMGIDGAFDAMDALTGVGEKNRRWGNGCG